MTTRKCFVIPLVILLSICLQVYAQNSNSLPRSNPEEEGVSSAWILKFLDAAESSKHEFHSFMFLRHGKVIAEGWWNPYSAELKHTMYSVSKSFTSTAIGFGVTEKRINGMNLGAIRRRRTDPLKADCSAASSGELHPTFSSAEAGREGGLSVEDKVISFFPNDLPDSISSNLNELKVKHLLTMSAGQDPDPTMSIRNLNTNWVKSFLTIPFMNKPGTRFLYNSMATFMLSAIIQKVTGEKLIDYLKPRLFAPLGIEGIDWEINPQGINTGGWGLRVTTEDLAKFGQLYLQKGKWNNKQLLPENWIEEATTIKILQSPEVSQSKRDSSDWLQGYGYKFWRCRYNAYRGDGAFGQFIIIMPDQDAVIAITAETTDMQDELNLVWKYLLPAIQNSPLPKNLVNHSNLKMRLEKLALPLEKNSHKHAIEKNINSKTFFLEPNEKQIEKISIEFENENCIINMSIDSSTYKISFGLGKWNYSETSRHGPNLISNAKFSFAGLPPSKIAGSYYWKDENTLELKLRYIESPHSEKFIFRFHGENLDLEIHNSIESLGKKVHLIGVMR